MAVTKDNQKSQMTQNVQNTQNAQKDTDIKGGTYIERGLERHSWL